MKTEYNRVILRFSNGKNNRVRDRWYSGSLLDIARSLGKDDEYDCVLAIFHGCVHSSAIAIGHGLPISPEYISYWASTIAVRMAKLCVEYNKLELNDFDSKLLAMLSKPYSFLASSCNKMQNQTTDGLGECT